MNDSHAEAGLPVAASLGAEPLARITALAARQRAAGGILMRLVNMAGGRVENVLESLPDGAKEQIEDVARRALEQAYTLAGRSHGGAAGRALNGDGAHRAMATASGALGGAGGWVTTLPELFVTTTTIFRAVQSIAASHGYDTADAAVRQECIRVFAAGGPGEADDGVNTSFLSSRLMLQGAGVTRLIQTVAPRLAVLMTQKLGAQAIPLVGAVAGAGVNYSFMSYFQEMAHVRFGLMRMADEYGAEAVADAFRAASATRISGRG